MIVCHCKGLTDRDIENAVDGGASARDIARCTGAGTGCGSCHRSVVKLIRRRQRESRELAVAPQLAKVGAV